MMTVRVDQLSSYYVLSPPLGNEGISLFVNLLHVNIRARLVGPLTLHRLSHRQLFIQFAKSLSVLSLAALICPQERSPCVFQEE